MTIIAAAVAIAIRACFIGTIVISITVITMLGAVTIATVAAVKILSMVLIKFIPSSSRCAGCSVSLCLSYTSLMMTMMQVVTFTAVSAMLLF